MSESDSIGLEANDRLFARMRTGQAASAAVDIIADELDRRSTMVHQSIFRILGDPGTTLDPQKAVQAFIELHEIHKLRQALTQRQRSGRKAAARLEPAMNAAGE